MFQVFDHFTSQVPHKGAVAALSLPTYALRGDACCEAYRALLLSENVSTGEFVPGSPIVRWGVVRPFDRYDQMNECQIVYEISGRFAYFWDEDYDLAALFGRPANHINRDLIRRGRADFLNIMAEQERLDVVDRRWLRDWRELDRRGLKAVDP